MDLTGQQLLPLPRDKVWAALLDPQTLRAAIPGCEFVNDEGNGLYSVGVLAAVGPVKARFKGRMQQQDLQPPHRYTLSFEGDGGMAGFAKGSAEVELVEEGEAREQTRLNYRAQAQIGGRLAQIGARLIDATVARMSQQFFDRFEEVLVNPALLDMPSKTSGPVASATRANGPVAVGAAPAGVVQMPAWLAGLALIVGAALIAWLAAH